jgi:hypothetical protein
MDNQHRKITGYRELSEDEIEMMNKIKGYGLDLHALIAHLGSNHVGIVADPRWIAIGKTHLQQGLMALTRSVAKPDFF